jgi:hypothetical protein
MCRGRYDIRRIERLLECASKIQSRKDNLNVTKKRKQQAKKGVKADDNTETSNKPKKSVLFSFDKTNMIVRRRR